MKEEIKNTVRWWKRAKVQALSIIFVSLGAGFSFGGLFILYMIDSPKITTNDFNKIPTIIITGDRINVLYDISKDRTCPIKAKRYLWSYLDLNGEKIPTYINLENERIATTNIPGSNKKYIISFPIPKDIWSGNWFYFSDTVDECPFFRSLFVKRESELYNIPINIPGDYPKPDIKDIVILPRL